MSEFRARRTILKQIVLATAGVSWPFGRLPKASEGGDGPWSDAVAWWQMASLADSAGRDSRLTTLGNARAGVKLSGADQAASRVRGGDGQAAELFGGWLSAGLGAEGELIFPGQALTALIRFRAAGRQWGFPLFSQYLSPTTGVDPAGRGSFNILTADWGDGPVLAGQLGNDAVSGFHLVHTDLRGVSPASWHDAVLRFDGRALSLFLDGALCDQETAVGTLVGRRRQCLIGADAHAEARRGRRVFRGLVDHAALWARALSDEEIARLSGVRRLADRRPTYYREKYRPQFHFSARRHWLNDPNGLFFYEGRYHLCFQYMPPGRPYGYRDWGHAVSEDLVHWRQLDSMLTPDPRLGGCWSGSAVIDSANTSGFQSGPAAPIVAIFTHGSGWNREPFGGPKNTQGLAYSTDGGATFQFYERNPVLAHIKGYNRDPKVIWHEPSRRWVMVLYIDGDDYSLFASPDLKRWEKLSDLTLPGTGECPDFFELPVAGAAATRRWIFWTGDGTYLIGTFDGATFHPESPPLHADHGANFYAAQTWSGGAAGDDRLVQIAWMRDGEYPQMPFSQQMNFPTQLTLRDTADGLRLHREPVREIERLHRRAWRWQDRDLAPGENPFATLQGDLWHWVLDIELRAATALVLNIRGHEVRYDAADRRLTALGRNAILVPSEGRIRLEILIDRTSVEVFANRGLVVLTSCFLPADDQLSLVLSAQGGPAWIRSAIVHSLHSIWA